MIPRAAEIIAAAAKPLIIAGGGVHYSKPKRPGRVLRPDRNPVSESQAGKGHCVSIIRNRSELSARRERPRRTHWPRRLM